MQGASTIAIQGGLSQRLISKVQCQFGYSAEADFAQRESGLWHLRGAEGDRLTERSEGRKLPQPEPRALAILRSLKTFLGVLRGGCKGGRSGDVVNTTGNHEQVAALPSRQRMISVPFRPAALPTLAAQTRKALFGIRFAGAAP